MRKESSNRARDAQKRGAKESPASTTFELEDNKYVQEPSDSDEEAPPLLQCQPASPLPSPAPSPSVGPPSSPTRLLPPPPPPPPGGLGSSCLRPSSSSVPITILSGLLGAGKTTLLRSLLTGKIEHSLKILAIQNEFSLESGVEAPLRITPLAKKKKKRGKKHGADGPQGHDSSPLPGVTSASPQLKDFHASGRKTQRESREEQSREEDACDTGPTASAVSTYTGAEDEEEEDYLPESVYELPNGCICCSIKDELIRTLEALLSRFPGKFDYVVVEASGVATPQQLIEAFWLDEPLQDQMHLDGIVTVVDPSNVPPLDGLCQTATGATGCLLFQGQNSSRDLGEASSSPPLSPSTSRCPSFSQNRTSRPPARDGSPQSAAISSPSPSSPPLSSTASLPGKAAVSAALGDLWTQQVVCADKVLVSKVDVASEEALAKTEALVRSLNPLADVLPVSFKTFRKHSGSHPEGPEGDHQKLNVQEFLHLNAYARGAATSYLSLLPSENFKQTQANRNAAEAPGPEDPPHKTECGRCSEGRPGAGSRDQQLSKNDARTSCIRSHCVSLPSPVPPSSALSSFLRKATRRERPHTQGGGGEGGGDTFHERSCGNDVLSTAGPTCPEAFQHSDERSTGRAAVGASSDPAASGQVGSEGESRQGDAVLSEENRLSLFSVPKLERLLSELLWREEDSHDESCGSAPAPVIYRCKGLFLGWKEAGCGEDEGRGGAEKLCEAEAFRVRGGGDTPRDSEREGRTVEAQRKRDMRTFYRRPWGVYELQGVGRTFEINSVDIACVRAMAQQEGVPRATVCTKQGHCPGGQDHSQGSCSRDCGIPHAAGERVCRSGDPGLCRQSGSRDDDRCSGFRVCTQARESSDSRQRKEMDGSEGDQEENSEQRKGCGCRPADTGPQECQTRRIVNKFLFVGRGIDPRELSERLRTECMQEDVVDERISDELS